MFGSTMHAGSRGMRTTGGAVDARARLWSAAVVGAGATVSRSQLNRVSTIIKSLDAAGVWSSLDRLWLFAAENATQALIDIKALASATAVNSPTFAVSRGYTGNASSSYINTNFNASTAGGNYARNSASMGAWMVGTSPAGTQVLIGNDDGSYSRIIPGTAAGVGREIEVNQGTPETIYAGTALTGFMHAQRTAAAVNGFFTNGGTQESAGTGASIALPNHNHLILAAPASVPEKFSGAQVAAGWIGASLASPLALYTPLRAYMTAVGVP